MDEVDKFLSENWVNPNKESSSSSEVDSFLEEYGAPVDDNTIRTTVPKPPTVTPSPTTVSGYSQSDLVKDEFYNPIKDYMVERFGAHMADIKDREEVVDMFLNNMRGFAGGNSVRAVNEIAFLNEVGSNEEVMGIVGKAYSIYENMESIFGETTLGEKGEIAKDFLRSAVLDPVNLIGFGLGKAATSSGFKAGSATAQIAARKVYKKVLAKEGVDAATKAATKTYQGLRVVAQREAAKKIARRRALRRATKGSIVKKVLNKEALKETATMAAVDSLSGGITDYMYQDAMLRTAVQDEYSVFQTGLATVGNLMFMGAVATGSHLAKGISNLVKPNRRIKTGVDGANLSDLFTKTVDEHVEKIARGEAPPSPPYSDWLKSVAKGKELTDQDDEFFIKMVLGDDELGLTGLVHVLEDQGYAYIPRTSDDTISNWVGDVIKHADPQDAKKFIDDFSKATGITMAEGRSLDIETFSNTFKKKVRNSMRTGNAMSQAAKHLGIAPSDVTANQWVEYFLTGKVPPTLTKAEKIAQSVAEKGPIGEFIAKDIPDFQNNIIRLLVSNMGTTALNVTGYTAATTLNSAQDIIRATMIGGYGAVATMMGKPSGRVALREARSLIGNQTRKLLNTLDPNMTHDAFLEYAARRPEAMKGVVRMLPGGIEDVGQLAQGFDPNQKIINTGSEKVVDFLQDVHLVNAQDSITKSIEFTTQLDKALRKPVEKGGFGMSWNDFFSDPNVNKYMRSERFLKAEAQALDETLVAIYSKSYKDKGTIGEFAGFIEDMRNLPGVGLLVPFGRFFNNTVAFMSNATIVWPLLSKMAGKNKDKPISEIIARGSATLGLITWMAGKEQEYIDMGLGWSEEVDPVSGTGAIIDEIYEYPYAAFKAAARLLAHRIRGDEIPTELLEQMGAQFFGQLTRQLEQTGTGIVDIFEALVTWEGVGELIATSAQAVGSQIMSGALRPVDPFNRLFGTIVQKEDDYVPDRDQDPYGKMFADSTRYMDSFINSIRSDKPPKRYSAEEGSGRQQTSKVLSTVREVKLSNTDRIMNMIGRPTWEAGMRSGSDVADNRYNQVFHSIVEDLSKGLINRPDFREAGLEYRKTLVSDVLEKAKESTLDFMGSINASKGDTKSAIIIDISGASQEVLGNSMEDLGYEGDLESLSIEELMVLQDMIDLRREFLSK